VLEAVFILLEFPSPSRRIFIGSHSFPPTHSGSPYQSFKWYQSRFGSLLTLTSLRSKARSVDGIFFGYASHSRAYRVLNLETNEIVETCEVTFDETQPSSQLVFECAGDDEIREEIF
jgi:hypothetical protein